MAGLRRRGGRHRRGEFALEEPMTTSVSRTPIYRYAIMALLVAIAAMVTLAVLVS